MQYEIIEEQIHIFLDADKTTNYALWPDELVQIVEAQEAGELAVDVPGLAELLSTVLEEHPEVFVCHYNSDLVM